MFEDTFSRRNQLISPPAYLDFQFIGRMGARFAAKISQTLRRTRKMLAVLPLVFLRHILVLLVLIALDGCEPGCQPQSGAWVPNTSQGHPFLANDFGTPTPRPIR